MAAIAVTSANTNSIFQAGRSVFRANLDYTSPIGNGFSVSGITNARIAALSATRIAVLNDTANTLTTYDFNGSAWSQVGNAKTITQAYASIATMSSTRIAFINTTGSTLQAYDFNDTDWTATGSAFSLTAITGISAIAALSSTAIALADSTNDKLVTYTFNGSAWSQTGNALTITGLGSCAIASLTSTRIALAHNSTNQIRAYDFDGTNWSQTGSAATPSLDAPSISAVSSTEILVAQYGVSTQYVYSFNGSAWTLTNTFSIAVNATAYCAICYLTTSRLVFIEEGIDTIQTYQFGKGGIPYVLSFYGTTIQISKGNLVDPTSWTHYTYSIIGTLIACVAGAIDSVGELHICWLEDNGTSSDLCYRTFNYNTNSWVTNTIINSDIGGDPYFSYLFCNICVDSNDKPHIAYISYPSISGGATYALWYINKVGAAWSSNVQVQHVKNRNNEGPDITVDLDDIPVISVATYTAANGTTVYRGNLNNATSFTGYIINSTAAHHRTGICIASNGDCYVISLDAVNSITVAKVWKHEYAAAWGTWTSMDFTFPNAAFRNTSPFLSWNNNMLYLFIEDNYDHDIKCASHDGTSWSALTVLETGTFNSAKAKWSLYNNNEKDNTESIDSSQTTNYNSSYETYEQLGWSFAGSDCRISRIVFKTSRTTSPITGQLRAKLYEIANISTAPSGTPIAISQNAEDVSTWTTTPTDKTWYFRDVEIKSGKFYAIVLDVPALGSNQRLNLHCAYQSDTLAGYTIYGTSVSTTDAYFLLYTKPLSNEIDYIFQDETATPDIWWNILSLAIPTSWMTKSLQWYNGSSWVAKPLKHHNGASWVTKPVKINM